MKKLLLIDSLNLLFRSYYAMRNLRTPDGKAIGMVFGLLNFVAKLRDENMADYVIFALDSSGGSFRKELLPDYKANRKELEPELKEQIPLCIELIKKMGFLALEKENYEADDVIASVCKSAKNAGIFTTIYSTDKDLFQLIDDEKVQLMGKNYEFYGSAQCIEKYGVEPVKMLDFLALVGDSADNFKGVPGVGPVAAKKLLKEHKNLDDIYANLNLLANKGLKNKLSEHKDEAFFSLKLAKLVDDLDFGEFLDKALMPEQNVFEKIKDELNEFNLKKFMKYLGDEVKTSTQEKSENLPKINLVYEANLLNDEAKLAEICANLDGLIGFDTETSGLEYDCKIVGFSFCQGQKSFYVPIAHENCQNVSMDAAKEAIQNIFKCHIVGHNLKFDFAVIKNNFHIDLPKKYTDSMLAVYLKNPSERCSLDAAAKRLLNHECISFESVAGKNADFAAANIDDAYKYAAEDAFVAKAIYEAIKDEIDEKTLAFECEFIKVLLKMQESGIMLKKSRLESLKNELEIEIGELEKRIFELAKCEFNINSPKQLAKVLYDDLGLEDRAKGSTNEQTLKELDAPIVKEILEYRTASKVLNTYALPLLELNEKNSDEFIVRTNFLQTGTATGRLSSSKPNLQNIPAKSRFAKKIKSAFIAPSGYTFIGLDYSQIELRMLAHFSKDSNLIDAFLSDLDIHAQTAMQIFGEVDEAKRSYAKSINFGLIYGMGARRLSQELKISFSDAKDYIEKYFAAFPSIKEYFERTKEQAKNDGFIKTLFGRKRYFSYSQNARANSANDRECINSVLQGSAADVIKMAMINFLPYLSDDIKLQLQIHDELVFCVRDDLADEFREKAINIMQNAVPLRVPLKVSVHSGDDYSLLK